MKKIQVEVTVPIGGFCTYKGEVCTHMNYLQVHSHNMCTCRIFEEKLNCDIDGIHKCKECEVLSGDDN